MASGKDWAVVVRQRTCSCAHACSDTNVHASAVWGPYATEAEAEAKKLELATDADKAPIVTILPLSPPFPNNKRPAATIKGEEDKSNKKTKPTKYQYTCIVAENFDEREIELTICVDGNTNTVVDEEWTRLHKYSGCDYEVEKDSDEEEEDEDESEEEHNDSECVTESNVGTVYTQKVYCSKDLKEYEFKKNEVYALVERCGSASEIEIKVSAIIFFLVFVLTHSLFMLVHLS